MSHHDGESDTVGGGARKSLTCLVRVPFDIHQHQVSSNVSSTDVNFSTYLNVPNQQSMFLDPVTTLDIVDIANKIRTKTSIDKNNISTKLLKKSIGKISEPLTHIVNLSLSTGVFPQDMKIAKVIPIYKSGENNLFKNYRPISILPAFSKILEKVVATKLMKFLKSSNQLYEHQYGFRPQHSTVHPVLHLLNQIAQENDKPTKNVTMATFLDLSRAFDTINHKILLKKLQNMGIRGVANLWFQSYLTNRQQFMEILSCSSSLETIFCGVPQGSILGPILFIIYVNDIYRSTKLKTLCFADDTTCSFSSNNIQQLYHTMNQELNLLNTWFRSNRLSLNAKKTKYILFGPQINQINSDAYEIYINNQRIDRIGKSQDIKSFKFLGIEIEENLSWKHHINQVCLKISRANYIINKVKNTIPKSCLVTLYHSLIQCHINYGLIAWGSASGLERIHKMQKKSLRIIHKKHYNYHTEPLFKTSQILKVQDQYKLNTATFMHQLKYHKLPSSFEQFSYFTEPTRPSRQIHIANQHRARTKFTALLPYHKLPQIWNMLMPSHRSIINTNKFKNEVNIYLLSLYSDNIKCQNLRCRQCFSS